MRSLPRNSLLKIPRQERSIETVHAVLDAAMRVLVEQGTAAFNTNRVAEVAGISTGSLYQYFANGEMILAGIVERGVLDAEELVRTALHVPREVPLETLLRAALSAVTVHLEPYSSLLAEIMNAAPLLATHGITTVLETRIMDAIRGLLARDPMRFRIPPGGPATLYVAVNGTIFVFLKWLAERPPHVSREELVESVVALARGVLVEVQPAKARAPTKAGARAKRTRARKDRAGPRDTKERR